MKDFLLLILFFTLGLTPPTLPNSVFVENLVEKSMESELMLLPSNLVPDLSTIVLKAEIKFPIHQNLIPQREPHPDQKPPAV